MAKSSSSGDSLARRIRKQLLIKPGAPAGLAARDTAWQDGAEFEGMSDKELKKAAKEFLAKGVEDLSELQELLWASDTYSLLVVFQAIDAAGKDSTIKHVMSGVNPQGVHVVSFKQPSQEELDHDFLWRIHKVVPERGGIGIFNRSHYEDVVAVRLHPEWLERQKLPDDARGPRLWEKRHEDINAFEHHLHRNGTRIVKFFLHVSKAEQKKRFLSRLDRPHKLWKFSPQDLEDRGRWDEFMQAYEVAITATSTKWAPWYVIPADNKRVMQAIVVTILVDAIRSLKLEWPEPTPEQMSAIENARRQLESEPDS